jgi:DNA-binding CsgD family transcriptional regulator
MLRGRTAERAVIDDALQRTRTGRGTALVVRGEPGIGKTALLRYAEERAGDLRVLRAIGVEGESEVAFAGLHQLLRPVVSATETLPGPQAGALRGALGLAPMEARDPLLVGAALLTLLADSADTTGLLCVIDDAQWLDQPSLSALLFAARRIGDDGVAVLFGVREHAVDGFPRTGLRDLLLEGLSAEDAAGLLLEHTSVWPAEPVRALLHELTRGNPLALLEIGKALSADQLRGRAPVPDPLPVGNALERVFADQVGRVSEEARSLLVLVAAESTGESSIILTATKAMGLTPVALEEAEAAGFIDFDQERITFRHPLIRSAVYRTASLAERREAHRVLAAACGDGRHADRRAWHLASAALSPDADVASALAETAQRAAARSGYAAAATALERSADLTPDGRLRARRLVDAAESAWLAGQAPRAAANLDRAADEGGEESELAADVAHLRGVFALRRGNVRHAFRILMEGVELAAEADLVKALTMLSEAAEAASYAGDPEGLAAAGERALELWDRAGGAAGSTAEFLATISGGMGYAIRGNLVRAAPLLQRGVALARASGDWHFLMLAGCDALYLGDIASARDFFSQATESVRSRGAVGALPYVLEYVVAVEGMAGELAYARAAGTEGIRLARETGQRTSEAYLLSTLAWIAALRGDEQECRTCAEDALEIATPNRVGLAVACAEWSLATLDIGKGRWDAAAARLARLMVAPPGQGHPVVALYAAPDCIESALRAENETLARRVFAGYEPWASSGALPAHGAARCRGLLAADADEAVAHFEQALAMPDVPTPERARTELVYGETLRRFRRRSDARAHLRAALDVFERAGAEPWAERARVELRATGETIRRRGPSDLEQLTPQEMQIARLVSAGASNRDVAAKLFLSPRTVEYHLYKVYPKLRIGSRAELADALGPLL